MLDKDPTHRIGGGCEKVTAVAPGQVAVAYQPHISFMHQCRRLQGVVLALGVHPMLRQFSQFLVNQRKQRRR